MTKSKAYVTTIKERCRICYTCIRRCPAKAIRVNEGQAEIIEERCIACGNCVKVCSQNAKVAVSSIVEFSNLIQENGVKVAIVAPSFPAEFTDITPFQLVGMIKELGFDFVSEVAFGADIVSKQYKKMLKENPEKHFISTACPEVVNYVEKYHPAIVPNLIPIVSPMVAQARVMKKIYGENIKIVFIGPCIAKKSETDKFQEIDLSLTFTELRELFALKKISPNHIFPVDFDEPHPGKGLLFPLEQGLVQSAEIDNSLMSNTVISAQGRFEFVEALREFENGDIDVRLLDLLSCEGCIMGPGFTTSKPKYSRHNSVAKYANRKYEHTDKEKFEKQREQFQQMELIAQFQANDTRLKLPSRKDLKKILEKMGKIKPEQELNCGACGYPTCIEHAIAIWHGLAENEMCLPNTIEQLKTTSKELSLSYKQLSNAQQALVQTEKLASMGQLAAGIAHEVNNPLGVVLLYAHILKDSVEKDSQIYNDICIIAEQTDRCKKIVGGLLNFARKNKVSIQKTNIVSLLEKCVELTTIPSNISLTFCKKQKEIIAEIDPDQIVQVITNIITNAIDAIDEKEGSIELCTEKNEFEVIIKIKDNGPGIKEKHQKKIFEPFFTTKKVGKGTGLGLAVAYGIIKMHKGQITVKSNSDSTKGKTGTTFEIKLPLKNRENNK